MTDVPELFIRKSEDEEYPYEVYGIKDGEEIVIGVSTTEEGATHLKGQLGILAEALLTEWATNPLNTQE